MLAREIMSYDPSTVTRTDTIRRAAELMRNVNVGSLPVVDEAGRGIVEGLITDRDIVTRCVAVGHDPWCLVAAHMTLGPLVTVGADADVSLVIEAMERAKVRRILVVDPSGVLLGIISQADVATKIGPVEPEKVEELVERISSYEPLGILP